MYTVGIRTDGGPDIGMGHMMRCLSLAKEFRRKGNRVCFICSVSEGIRKVIEEGFEVIQLDREINERITVSSSFKSDFLKEAYQMVSVLGKNDIQVLIVDKYDIPAKYFFTVKPYVRKLIYIDDLNKLVYPVDIVINGNITAAYMNYEKYSADQQLLLGPAYNMIREEFRNVPKKKIYKSVKHIMVTTGGSDSHGMTLKFLGMILSNQEFADQRIHVILGSLFTQITDLKKIGQRDHRVILYENVSSIWEIMHRADIAVSAGGTTLYELAACGTPTLAFVSADNQEFLVEKMHEKGYVISLGWFYQIEASAFLSQLKAFINDYQRRENMSRQAQNLVDGRGVERIVKHIDKIMGESNETSPLLL